MVSSFTALFAAVAAVSLLSLQPALCDETNWNPWLALPEPRTGAQAVLVDRFVFIVGGTSGPYSFANITGVGATADGATPVLLWVDFSHVFQWKDLPRTSNSVQLPPISAKCGAAGTRSSIFIAYAASILSASNNAFLEVQLPLPLTTSLENGAAATVVQRAPTLTRRNSAALGVLKKAGPAPGSPPGLGPSTTDYIPSEIDIFYLFGGRNGATMQFEPSVEMYFNGTWSVVAAMPTGIATAGANSWCACSVTQTSTTLLMIFGCVDCQSGAAIHTSLTFDTTSNIFATQPTPLNVSNNFYLPSNAGGPMGTLAMFAPTIYELPGPNGPAINMFDTLLHQQNEIVTIAIQERRTACAQFALTANVFCVGGTVLSGASTTAVSDQTQVLPSPAVTLDKADQTYLLGDNIVVYAGQTCGTGTARLRLATSPTCETPIPYVSDIDCQSVATFNLAQQIALREGQQLTMYLCYTQGSCAARGHMRQMCGGGTLTNDDCRWGPCCWDNVRQECFAYIPADITDDAETFWVAVDGTPITIVQSLPVPAAPEAEWYQSKYFYIGCAAGGAVVLYFIVAFFWKRQVSKEHEARRAIQANLFTAFGKSYNVLGQIGQGAFGTVFLAERTSDGRKVALKVLPCADAKQRDAALAEYDVLYGLQHENLIRVIDLILNWDTTSARGEVRKRRKTRRANAAGGGDEDGGAAAAAADTTPGSGSTAGVSATTPGGSRRAIADSSGAKGVAGSVNGGGGGPGDDDVRRAGAEELVHGPLVTPLLQPTSGETDSGSDTRSSTATAAAQQPPPRAYGSFQTAVNFSTAENIDQNDFQRVTACPRFICIVSDYYPDGNLTDFILSYGQTQEQRLRKRGSYIPLTPPPSSGGGCSSSPKKRAAAMLGGAANSAGSSGSGAAAAAAAGARGASMNSDVPLPERLVRSFATQLCSLLAYTHSRRRPVIHRDLKPDNILLVIDELTGSERLIVSDFGLAGFQAPDEYATTRAGTLLYSAPEVFKLQITPAADMWGCGCVLYACMTRRVLPETTRVMFSDVDDEDFEETMRADMGNYSRELQDLVLAMLHKDPAERLTASQALVMLQQFSAVRSSGAL